MSEVDNDEVWDLVEEAMDMPDGPAKVGVMEQAVRLADALNDVETSYQVRLNLLEACTFGGYPEKALVAFAWCQTQFDKDPERFEEHDLLWRQKWIIDKLANFPQFSKQQIYEMLDDMARRYEAWGAGKRSELKLRYSIAYAMGDKSETRRLMGEWEKTYRDDLTDCEACEVDDLVEMNTFFGDYESAVKAGDVVLKTPLRCMHVPHTTHARLLKPLFFLGRYQEAMQNHRKGYPMIRDNPAFLCGASQTLEFLVLTDNLGKATKVLEAHLSWATDTKELWMRFRFYLSALLLLNTLLDRGKETISLTLNQTCPYAEPGGKIDLKAMRDRMMKEAEAIGASFDKRNENTYFKDWMKEHDSYRNRIIHVPLKSTVEAR